MTLDLATATALAHLGESLSGKTLADAQARFACLGYELYVTPAGFVVKNHCRRAVLPRWRYVCVVLEDLEGGEQ